MSQRAKPRLAVVCSHPIQYNAPLFNCIVKRGIIDIKVFYTWGEKALHDKYDPGFGKVINWDIPLLEGYSYQFLHNAAKDPGTHHFNGIINPDLADQIRSWQPNHVLVYGWKFRSHLQVMRSFKGVLPVFFRGDSTLLDDQSPILAFFRHMMLNWVYRHVDKVFFVGTNNKKYFLDSGVKENELVLAPHAVDNDFFSDSSGAYEKEAGKWRQELGIPENNIVFLFAGKLEAKKAPGLLLNVFMRSGIFDKAHLVIVGSGAMEAELKKTGTKSNVHFVDFQNQSRMPVVYRLADVFVLPSEGPGETWGLAINEAMASGRPVVASDKCGGTVDLIIEGITGYSFKAGNASDLESKMALIMSSPKRLKEMGKHALELIQEFSILKVARQIEHSILENSTSP